jgi:hypothetical protein
MADEKFYTRSENIAQAEALEKLANGMKNSTASYSKESIQIWLLNRAVTYREAAEEKEEPQ